MGKQSSLSTSILSFFLRHKAIITFGIITLIMYMLNLWMLSHYEFYYDSGGYWFLRKTFVVHGKFRITNFDNPLRSYLFPLILFTISKVGRLLLEDRLQLFLIICESVVYSSFLTILIPKLVQVFTGRTINYVFVWIFSLLTIYFWRGYFYYPLTDMPALAFSCLAVYLVLKYYRTWWGGFIAGITLGAAAMIRPSYQIIVIPFILWLFFFWRYEGKLSVKRNIIQTSIFLIGLISVYIPQTIINSSNFDTFSPFVQTHIGQGTDLFTQQLIWGISVQKYETNVGEDYPFNRVVFFDKQGEKILMNMGLQELIFSPTDEVSHKAHIPLQLYLEIMLKHPIEFIWIYLRHLFNGLDLRYDTPYLSNVFADTNLFQLLNYSAWFLAISFVIEKLEQIKRSLKQIVPVLLVCLPAILSIPTAVETRFMLPLYILCYVVVTFFVLPETLQLKAQDIKHRIFESIPSYVTFVTICFLLSSNTYMGLQ